MGATTATQGLWIHLDLMVLLHALESWGPRIEGLVEDDEGPSATIPCKSCLAVDASRTVGMCEMARKG